MNSANVLSDPIYSDLTLSHNPILDRRVAVAPMLDCTDRHARYFYRLLSPNTLLYTEMVVTQAILHGPKDQLLQFHNKEHPVALQLGGSDPNQLSQCAVMAENLGYDEVNLNVGCPSDRVQKGQFGLCLMARPALVAQCVDAMKQVVDIPITVKTRTGYDEHDAFDVLADFTEKLIDVHCDFLWVHARKGWLNGLSPKENRNIPPLNYERVYRLKKQFPKLGVGINGGILTTEQAQDHLQHVDGVMLGRGVYQSPYWLAELESSIFGSVNSMASRHEIVEQMLPYIEEQLSNHQRLHHITRHMFGLFHGQMNARLWRRYLSEHGPSHQSDVETLKEALKLVT